MDEFRLDEHLGRDFTLIEKIRELDQLVCANVVNVLIAGDVVEALETQLVSSASQFSNAVRVRPAGDEVVLKVRRDKAARELRVKLASRPKEDEG